MILHDHVLSAEGYAVRLLLALAGAPHEHRVVDILDPGSEPVPRLEAGGRAIVGMGEILPFLVREPDFAGWLPAEERVEQEVLRWLAFADGDLGAAMRLREARLFDWPADRDDLEARALAAYRTIDDHLAEALILGRPFLVGERPTIADIACFPALALADDVGIPLDRFHAIGRFVDAMIRLPRFVPMPGILALPD